MALVAFAGPFTNFLLALIAFLIGHLTGILYGTAGDIMQVISRQLVFTNLGFMIFNLIPIPPLDGSRIIYAIAPDVVRKYMDQMEAYGIIIVYFLVLFFGELFSSYMIGAMNGILDFFYLLVGVK